MSASKEKIIDTALQLAEKTSWEAVRLHTVASELGASLHDVHAHFRDKEEIADAWFDRADSAMLRDATQPDFQGLTTRARLHRAIMTWLATLAPHRRVTRQMIGNKFEPGHLHYQIAGATRVSRTVQWLREAAHRETTLPWRALEETALTGVLVATVCYWMMDDSKDAVRTRAFVDRLLARAETVSRYLPWLGVPARSKPRSSRPAGASP